MLIDTHAHLYADEFDKDREEMILRAKNAGVKRVYLPNIDVSSIEPLYNLYLHYTDFFRPMMGLHPCYVDKDYKQQMKVIDAEIHSRSYVAVGEAGMDLVRDEGFKNAQEECLREQCKWAKEMGLPIILHSRGAIDETIKVIEEEQDGRLRGIFHCFTGDDLQANKIMDVGFLMGVGGIVTFKNAELDRTVSNIPLTHLVLETDAPYLAPHPKRGKRNESAYLLHIVEKMASIFDTSVDEISRITNENALKLFGDHK